MTEQGMQVYSVIFKRVWRSMKEEFKKLHALNGTYLPPRKSFGEQGQFILKEDYKSDAKNVIPVADPNITSNAMRVAQAGAVAQRAYSVPGYSLPEVEMSFLRAMRVPNIRTMYPGPDKVPPLPNPKMAVENAKSQIKQAQLKWEQQKFMAEMQEQIKLNKATIAHLEASALKLASDAKDSQAMTRIAEFNTLLEALKTHNEGMQQRVESMKEGETDGGNEGGSGSVASGSGDAGSEGVSQ
jgi:chaperonin GroES